eukprot:m.184629 g.184629  ORF g.184629 m.184629 type:complete len:747 (+) comp53526_c0_seq1:96-2336(+)
MSTQLKTGLATSLAAAGSKAAKSVRVRVCVRVRPFLPAETGQLSIIQAIHPDHLLLDNYRYDQENLKYTFDACYGDASTQSMIFQNELKPLLRGPLQGQNTTCFAFGPTGAGKTHTMQGTPADPGVIPSTIKEIFFLLKADAARFSYEVTMSYLEIYNEKVYDLLDVKDSDLQIREDLNHNILIPGLSETKVDSLEEFERLFESALRNRSTAPTKLNSRSSRSHAVLMIKIARQEKSAPYRKLLGKINLIDLAGSEDNRKTENQGARLKESGAINMSLFVLGKVVDALNEGAARIPFRDSKLTRLLQDSLGGDSRACIIANIAPCRDLYFDTYNSLNFASKSRNIVNRPTVHQTINAPAYLDKPSALPVPSRTVSSSAASSAPSLDKGAASAKTDSTPSPTGKRPAMIAGGKSQSRLNSGFPAGGDKNSPASMTATATSSATSTNSGKVHNSVPVRVASGSSLATTQPKPLGLRNETVGLKSLSLDLAKRAGSKDSGDHVVVEATQLFTPSKKLVMGKTYVEQAQLFEATGNLELAREQLEKALALIPGQAKIEAEILRLTAMINRTMPARSKTAGKPSTKKSAPTKRRVSELNVSDSSDSARSALEDAASDDSDDESPIRGQKGVKRRRRISDNDWEPQVEPLAEAASEDEEESAPVHRVKPEPLPPVTDPLVREVFICSALKLLNEGDVKQLTRLKGIGAKKAERIIECRSERGPFAAIAEMKKVGFAEKGIEKFISENLEVAF